MTKRLTVEDLKEMRELMEGALCFTDAGNEVVVPRASLTCMKRILERIPQYLDALEAAYVDSKNWREQTEFLDKQLLQKAAALKDAHREIESLKNKEASNIELSEKIVYLESILKQAEEMADYYGYDFLGAVDPDKARSFLSSLAEYRKARGEI